MSFIKRIFSSAWSTLDKLKNNYFEYIFTKSFSSLTTEIGSLINKRTSLLAKFARASTRRLQAIRKMDSKLTSLKKAQVTRDVLSSFLRTRQSPVKDLLTEVDELISIVGFEKATKDITGFQFAEKNQCLNALYNEALKEFSKDFITGEQKVLVEESKQPVQEKNLALIIQNYTEFRSRSAQINKIIYAPYKGSSMPQRLADLIGLIKNSDENYKVLTTITHYQTELLAMKILELKSNTTLVIKNQRDDIISSIRKFVKKTREETKQRTNMGTELKAQILSILDKLPE